MTTKTYARTCAVILMLVVPLFIVHASGKPDDASKVPATESVKSKVTEGGEFPVYKGEPVTFKIFTKGTSNVDFAYEKNAYTKYITDMTGVNIEWIIEPIETDQKLNMLFVSKDLPDVIFYRLTPAMQMKYGSDGILIQLEDLLMKYGHYFKKNVVPYKPNVLDLYRMSDGKIYCAPKVQGMIETIYQQFQLINRTWLDKLGLKMPGTTEEFKQVLMAFKTKDPNGNGKADEVPLTGLMQSGTSALWGYLMLPFIYHDGAWSTLINRDANEIFPAFTQNGWKAGLEYMNDLYRNGLLDPGAFTYPNANQIKALMAQDVALIGSVPTKSPHNIMDPALKRVYEYEYVPPLAGPGGVRRQTYNPDASAVGDNFMEVAITSACKYPEIAIRFIDAFYSSWDVWLSGMFGVKGEDWRSGMPGEVDIYGRPAGYVTLKTVFGTASNHYWGNVGPAFVPYELRYSAAFDLKQVADKKLSGSHVYWQNRATINLYAPYGEKKSHFYNNLLPTLDVVDEWNTLESSINTYVVQSIAEFISGQRNIATEWDGYLKNLDKLGLGRWMQLNIDAAKRQYKETLTYRK